MQVSNKKFRLKRSVEYICNYLDDEWLDIIGTNGVRLSIPSSLVSTEIFPDDVLLIEVKRDELKTKRRRLGRPFCTLIDSEILEDEKEFNDYTNLNLEYQALSNIISFPRKELLG